MMRLRKVVGGFLVAISLITAGSLASATGAEPAKESSAPVASEVEAIKATLSAAFDAKYRSLIKGSQPGLHQFYASTAQGLAGRELSRLNQHWAQVAKKHGFEYTDVEIYLDFHTIDLLSSTEATITLTEEGRLTHRWNTSGESTVERYSNLDHTITMVQEGGAWQIVSDDYFDMFLPRPATRALLNPVDNKSTGQETRDVGTMGFNVPYNRNGAKAYATTYCQSRNPKYKSFTVNCTNFVSQAVKEGGGAANDFGGGDDFIWWYDNRGTDQTNDDQNSTSWSVAHDQVYHWRRNSYNGPAGSYVSSPTQLAIGDVIYYDFPDPDTGRNDEILDHAAIVVGFSNGQPYVAYNTTDTCWRHWDLGAPLTKFLKLNNSFYYN